MGTVPIWKQWLIIAAGACLSPVIVLAVACAFGWVIFRRMWPRRVAAVESAHAPAGGDRFHDLSGSTSDAVFGEEFPCGEYRKYWGYLAGLIDGGPPAALGAPSTDGLQNTVSRNAGSGEPAGDQ